MFVFYVSIYGKIGRIRTKEKSCRKKYQERGLHVHFISWQLSNFSLFTHFKVVSVFCCCLFLNHCCYKTQLLFSVINSCDLGLPNKILEVSLTLRAAAWWDMVLPTRLSLLYCCMSAIHSSHWAMISTLFK